MFVSPQAYMMYYRNDIEYFEMKKINKKINKDYKLNKNEEINKNDEKKQDYDVKINDFGNIKLIIEYFA
jgi:hypothetical protein|tara:strand:+ start:431 stop:637 length:207 start_codon:yes stop_codon:yes gene_type:complete